VLQRLMEQKSRYQGLHLRPEVLDLRQRDGGQYRPSQTS